MSDKVVSLHGAQIAVAPKKPIEGVVEELERLLDLARAGELVGIAAVYKHAVKPIEYSFAGSVSGFAMVGGLECLKLRLAQTALDRG